MGFNFRKGREIYLLLTSVYTGSGAHPESYAKSIRDLPGTMRPGLRLTIASKMWDLPVPGCQTFRTNKRSAPKPEHQTLAQQYPEADAQLKQLLKLLGDVEDVVRHISDSVRESAIGLSL
jgi:hypothetical protein